jgi:hypothetical protein
MKAVETGPMVVVDGRNGSAVLTGAGDVVLQLRGSGKGENHTKILSHGARGDGSPRRSKGGGGMAKSDGGGVALAAGADKTESWEGERGKGTVLGKQSATKKEDGKEGHGGFSLL